MPIAHSCHDYAFTRCFPFESRMDTPVAQGDQALRMLVQTNMLNIHPNEVGNLDTGVLTLVDIAPAAGAHCPHSYYVDNFGNLIGLNDPFAVQCGINFQIVNQYEIGAIQYTLAQLQGVMNNVAEGPLGTAQLGDIPRTFLFYWCSTAVARLGWWA